MAHVSCLLKTSCVILALAFLIKSLLYKDKGERAGGTGLQSDGHVYKLVSSPGKKRMAVSCLHSWTALCVHQDLQFHPAWEVYAFYSPSSEIIISVVPSGLGTTQASTTTLLHCYNFYCVFIVCVLLQLKVNRAIVSEVHRVSKNLQESALICIHLDQKREIKNTTEQVSGVCRIWDNIPFKFYLNSCPLKTYPQTMSHPSYTKSLLTKLNSAIICSITLNIHYFQWKNDDRVKIWSCIKDCADAEQRTA